MAPIALSDSQLAEIKTAAYTLPPFLRGEYLQRIAKLLPAQFDDADVWRAAHRAARELVLNGASRRRAG
jgi:hypothetical protein